MSAASPTRVSFEDYLVDEATSDVKHEWCDGVVYAMSRGTPEHARLTMRIASSIGAALAKGCEVYSCDLMLYIEPAKLSTYADFTVVSGAVETKTVRKNGKSLGEAVTNPTIIVEVLSDATERYDRDGKFRRTSSSRRSANTCWSRRLTNDASATRLPLMSGDEGRHPEGNRRATSGGSARASPRSARGERHLSEGRAPSGTASG